MADEVTLYHPDLPGKPETTCHPDVARVLAKSGWKPVKGDTPNPPAQGTKKES